LAPGSKVIACEVFRDELAHLGVPPEACCFLEQPLHRTPEKLNQRIAQAITEIEASSSPSRIILVFGYCGGGL